LTAAKFSAPISDTGHRTFCMVVVERDRVFKKKTQYLDRKRSQKRSESFEDVGRSTSQDAFFVFCWRRSCSGTTGNVDGGRDGNQKKTFMAWFTLFFLPIINRIYWWFLFFFFNFAPGRRCSWLTGSACADCRDWCFCALCFPVKPTVDEYV